MELVISIVSWNTKDLLHKCLTSLRRHVRVGHTRVVVIDNASKDGTPEMIRAEFPEVTLIESGGNLGFGKAHNFIARHSTEPYVLFLNPDTEFTEPAHESMLNVFKRSPDVGLVGCRMTNLDGSVQPLGWQWHTSPWTELLAGLFVSRASTRFARHFLPYQDPLKDGFVHKLYGGCLMARRECLNKAGWFDERFFMYGEDVDLSRRMEAAGFRLFYLSSASVVHVCGGASAKAPGRFSTLMQCESISKLMEKYYGRLGRMAYILGIQARALLRLGLVAGPKAVFALLGRRRVALENSWAKHTAMLRWSFGLDRPSIPK